MNPAAAKVAEVKSQAFLLSPYPRFKHLKSIERHVTCFAKHLSEISDPGSLKIEHLMY